VLDRFSVVLLDRVVTWTRKEGFSSVLLTNYEGPRPTASVQRCAVLLLLLTATGVCVMCVALMMASARPFAAALEMAYRSAHARVL
jgi:hypothetical protein